MSLSLFLSTVFMNIENYLAEAGALLLFTAGAGAWFGLYWGWRATRELLLVRILAPLVMGLAAMGFYIIMSALFQILFILSFFIFKAMLYPIPFTLAIMLIGTLHAVSYIQGKVRKEVENAFQFIPPAVQAAEEQLQDEHDHNQEEQEQDEHENQVPWNEEDAEATDNLNEEFVHEEIDDNETIVGEQQDQDMHPEIQSIALIITPFSSPIQTTSRNNYNVVEPLEFLRPAGGAGIAEIDHS